MKKNKNAFTLVEILVTIAIIGLLAGIVIVALNSTRYKARDVKRKSDLSQIGRFFSLSCYLPDGGVGEYDLNQLLDEFRLNYPQYANSIPSTIKDPKSGTEAESFYKYIVDENNNCVLYANLENDSEEVTLPNISTPTPAGGKGVWQAASAGWNGSDKYFQVSN